MRAGQKANWTLYVLTDEEGGYSHLEVAREAIAGGATAIQFRDKKMGGRQLVEVAQALRKLTRETGVVFIVNDRVDVALAVGADGVHVGQEDIPAAIARRLVGPDKIVGLSVTNLEEALEAEREGVANYLGVGPIFPTGTKPDAAPPIGLKLLAEVSQHVSTPVVAIGGIGAGNATATIEAGADGVAVVHAIAWAEDVAAAARELRAIVENAKSRRGQ